MAANVYQEDMEFISSAESIDWKLLAGKTIFITGGTGLIGSTVINGILYANNKYKLNARIIAFVRNLERAKGLFHSVNAGTSLSFIVGSVESLPEVQEGAFKDTRSFCCVFLRPIQQQSLGLVHLILGFLCGYRTHHYGVICIGGFHIWVFSSLIPLWNPNSILFC